MDFILNDAELMDDHPGKDHLTFTHNSTGQFKNEFEQPIQHGKKVNTL
jgi:hypothetical protein